MKTGGSEANAIRMLEMASEPPFLEMKMAEKYTYTVFIEVDDTPDLVNRERFEKISRRQQSGAGFGMGRSDVSWDFVRESAARKLFNRLRRYRANNAEVWMIRVCESGTDIII